MQILNITIGTAGHIDHGKSELIRSLTGIHPDRLKEERERGMTIDLGYSFYTTNKGDLVGVIDVPGHERFIKNMVAGATSVNLVLFAVAADDGVMPQTSEHLNIMSILGIERGIIALTKIDLVDDEMVELAAEEIRELTIGTFLEDAPIIPISATQGRGIETLREVLEEAIAELKSDERPGAFRMPIQRVFSAKGFGTVVTGVPLSGTIRVGDQVELLPLAAPGRIRGIQAYDRACTEGRAGHRTALNISDVSYRDLKRGDTVATPGCFRSTEFFEADFQVFESFTYPLKNMAEVRVHAGTSEVMANLVLLERKTLQPGDQCLIQLRLKSPLVTVPGDSFVLRLHSPMITIGGGRVLGVTPLKLKRFKDHILGRVAAKRDTLTDLQGMVLVEAKEHKTPFFASREVAESLNLPPDAVTKSLHELRAAGDIIEARTGLFMHRERYEILIRKMLAFLEERHRDNPLTAYVDLTRHKGALSVEPTQAAALLKIMEKEGFVELAKGGRARRAGFTPQPSESQIALIAKIENLAHEAGARPPSAKEISSLAGENPKELEPVIQYLLEEERLIKVGSYLFHADILEQIREAMREVSREHGEVKIPIVRDRFQTSRKWMIPLVEYLDDQGFTRREGERRFLVEEP